MAAWTQALVTIIWVATSYHFTKVIDLSFEMLIHQMKKAGVYVFKLIKYLMERWVLIKQLES